MAGRVRRVADPPASPERERWRAGNLFRQDRQDLIDLRSSKSGSLQNQTFRNQEFITKRGNLKNTKKKELTTRSLLSLEAQNTEFKKY